MGQKLMRVPLDFNWPQGKVWGGYLNPFTKQCVECHDCGGSGSSPEAKRVSDEWYGNAPFDPAAYGAKPLTVDHPAIVDRAKRNVEHGGQRAIDAEARRLFGIWRGQWSHQLIQADVDALVAADRLYDFTRRPRNEEQAKALEAGGGYWMKEHNGYTPTADEVNDWSMRGFGHDAINQWVCVKARLAREGITQTECLRCGGEGCIWPSAEIKAASEAWEETEPPEGPGFQLWETTSEGSPSSPVFETIEALCEWCAKNATTFGSFKASAEKWRLMLDANFVCHEEGNAVFL